MKFLILGNGVGFLGEGLSSWSRSRKDLGAGGVLNVISSCCLDMFS